VKNGTNELTETAMVILSNDDLAVIFL